MRRTEYVYFPWTTVNGAGRLQQLKSGTSGNMTSLQNLTYTYDATANVKTLTDGQNSAQRQCFTYDDLDRLTRGFTGNDACTAYDGSRGAGVYDELYEYTNTNGKIGNLTRKGDGYYYYDSTRKHAVRSVIGTGGSSLIITIRAKGTSYGGVWPSMSLRVNGAVVKTWTVNTTSYTNYTHSTTLSGNDVLEVAYTNDESTRTLYVDYVIVNGVTIQAESGAMVYDQGAGSAAYDGFDVIAGREILDVNGALRFVKGAKARNAGYDANGNMTSRLEDGKAYLLTYDSENRLTTVENLATGQTTTFTYDGDGTRVRVAIGSTTTVYIDNYYEKNTSTGVVTKYYYTGSQRVAMRVGASTWYFLLTDHLGSTAKTATSSGTLYGELRYRAWGENRYSWGTTPTTYHFTGQREESTIGLYFYSARWYDTALGRFTQADTIVPEPGNPQALNRYAYALNNPVRYRDPSGHAVCVDAECAWIVHPVSGEIRQRRPTNSPPESPQTYSPTESYQEAMGLVNSLLACSSLERDLVLTVAKDHTI